MAKNRRHRRPASTTRWPLLARVPLVSGPWRRGVGAAACGLALSAGLWWGVPVAWRSVKSNSYFTITRTELTGHRRLTRDEVLQWAAVPDGTSVWDARPPVVQAELQRHPWIERASVVREFPRRLVIRIRERTPVAIVSLDNQLQYVDRAGKVLGPLRAEDSRDFPILTGLDSADSKGFNTVALHRSLQLLRWCERLRCFDTISEIKVDRVRGLTVFPLNTPVPVRMGWGNWRDKLARSARVFAAWQGQPRRLAQVDVSFRNSAIVTLQDEPRPSPSRPTRRGVRV